MNWLGEPADLRRSIRLVSIITACRDSGVHPVPGSVIHTIAYLADALAPVWGLPILDAQVLKQPTRPFFPALQTDIDCLVGRGVVGVSRFSYDAGSASSPVWSLNADYELLPLASPIIEAINSQEGESLRYKFVREVTFAAAGLGPEAVSNLGQVDAMYSDPDVDVGGMLDLDDLTSNKTTEVAKRFNLLAENSAYNASRLIHLYVRHLHARMRVA